MQLTQSHVVILIVLLIFVGIIFLASITSNSILAQTMTINNVTGNSHDNATGNIVIKNIQGITNPSDLISKAMSHIPGNTTSLKSGISQWWQYNAGSRLAP